MAPLRSGIAFFTVLQRFLRKFTYFGEARKTRKNTILLSFAGIPWDPPRFSAFSCIETLPPPRWQGGWVGWVAGWLGWLGWLAGWLAGWLVGWLAGWLVGWLASWLVGWLAG